MKYVVAWICVLGVAAVPVSVAGQSGAGEKKTEKTAREEGAARPPARPAPPASGSGAAAEDPAGKKTAARAPAASRPAPAPAPATAPAPGPSSAPAPAPRPAPESASDRKPLSHLVWLRQISQRIERLKEEVSAKQKEIAILKEAVLHGSAGGAQLVLVHANRLGSSFRLVSMRYLLDRMPILIRRDLSETRLGRRGSAEIYNGPIRPGRHTLSVELKLRGHGFGVYSYLRGYRFQVLSSDSFTVSSGSKIRVEAEAYEKPDAPLKQRPAVRFKKKDMTARAVSKSKKRTK